MSLQRGNTGSPEPRQSDVPGCQTPGAIFRTSVSPEYVECRVELPPGIALSQEDATALDARIHDAMALALVPLWARA